MESAWFPPHLENMLRQKQIRNLKPADIDVVFPEPFDISGSLLYCIGRSRETGVKDAKVVMLLACQKIPLIGAHRIQYMRHENNNARPVEEIIYSLNTIRGEQWFDDKLPFDRATFLLHHNVLVRLSIIRHRIRLPLLEDPYKLSEPNPFVFIPSIRFVKNAKCIRLISRHVHTILSRIHDTPAIAKKVRANLKQILVSVERFGDNGLLNQYPQESLFEDSLLPALPILEEEVCELEDLPLLATNI